MSGAWLPWNDGASPRVCHCESCDAPNEPACDICKADDVETDEWGLCEMCRPTDVIVIHDAVGLPKPALHFRNAERAVQFAESVNAKLELEQRFGPGAAA